MTFPKSLNMKSESYQLTFYMVALKFIVLSCIFNRLYSFMIFVTWYIGHLENIGSWVVQLYYISQWFIIEYFSSACVLSSQTASESPSLFEKLTVMFISFPKFKFLCKSMLLKIWPYKLSKLTTAIHFLRK